MNNDFINLHAASSYSTHWGASLIDDILFKTGQLGQTAIAITNRDSLAGVVQFAKKAVEMGIKPITGCKLTELNHSVVLLARNRQGYEFISRMITARHLNENFSLLDSLSRADDNVIVLVSDAEMLNNLADRMVNDNRDSKAVESFADSSYPTHLFADIIASKDPCYLQRSYHLAREADRLGIPLVLTTGAYGTCPDRWEVHRVLRAIDCLTSVNRLKSDDYRPADCYLKSADDLRFWEDKFPGSMKQTLGIADMCDYAPVFEKWVFPEFPVPNGETSDTYLCKIARDGLFRKIQKTPSEYVKRLDYELAMIEKLGFSCYFLAVWEIVKHAEAQDIPCIGRGSAANSLVSYCLGLTHVDPIKSDLFFERFMNPWRSSPPDIDIDISWKRRDEIIDWVYERYGRDRVAMISTHVTFRMRSAIREVAKAYGISDSEALSVTEKIPWGWNGNTDALIEYNPMARELPFDQSVWQKILRTASQIQGFVQHLSIHCGGIVITPDPITNHLPLQRSGITGKGLAVTQFEMHAVENMGLIKIDLLGNRSLGVYTDIMDILRERGVTPEMNDHDKIFTDPATVELIRTGRTMGCFYIESPAMRSLLKKLHVVDFEGLTAASSVIRPGVAESGMMDEYIKRHNDPSLASYLHPLMSDILHKTHGVMIYQEDVIRVVHHIAGMSLAEADLLRRAMSGKLRGRKTMREFEDEFVSACVGRGIDYGIAREIWRQISSFAGYSFCKGHSASFAILSFQMTYLKAHFPALFMARVMSNFGGFYGLGAYIAESRRLGIRVKSPDINNSSYLHEEIDGDISLGFVIVKNLEHKTIERIVSEREKNGVYQNLYDFVRRTSITPSQLRILIECGACDSLGEKRPKMLMQSEIYMSTRKLDLPELASNELFPSHDPSPKIKATSDFDQRKRIEMEFRHFGRIVSCHPLEFFKQEMVRMKVISSSDMHSYSGHRIFMAGWIIAHKTIRTRKNNRLMKFLSMEDLDGTYEVTMFPDSFEKHSWKTRSHGPYLISGKVESHFGVSALTCDRIELLSGKIEFGIPA